MQTTRRAAVQYFALCMRTAGPRPASRAPHPPRYTSARLIPRRAYNSRPPIMFGARSPHRVMFRLSLFPILCASALAMGAWQTEADNNSAFVDGLKRNRVVSDSDVEAVMRRVDRINYCRHPSDAYVDSPQAIGDGQTISAPHMHAAALEILKPNLKPGASVLDVGSGSGYLSACFARMIGRGRVVGIEVNQRLVDWSRSNVQKADGDLLASGLLELHVGDGWRGWPAHAPYDAIHVGAAAESVPMALVEQLKPGGRMVIPVGRHQQELLLVWKDEHGKAQTQHLMDVRYVPLVKPHDVKV